MVLDLFGSDRSPRNADLGIDCQPQSKLNSPLGLASGVSLVLVLGLGLVNSGRAGVKSKIINYARMQEEQVIKMKIYAQQFSSAFIFCQSRRDL